MFILCSATQCSAAAMHCHALPCAAMCCHVLPWSFNEFDCRWVAMQSILRDINVCTPLVGKMNSYVTLWHRQNNGYRYLSGTDLTTIYLTSSTCAETRSMR